MFRMIALLLAFSFFYVSINAQENRMTSTNKVEYPKAVEGCLVKLDKHIKSADKAKLIKYPGYGGKLHLPTWISVHCVEDNQELKNQFAAIGLTDVETISMFIYRVYSNKIRNIDQDFARLLKNSLREQEIRVHGVPEDAKAFPPPLK